MRVDRAGEGVASVRGEKRAGRRRGAAGAAAAARGRRWADVGPRGARCFECRNGCFY